MIKQAIIPLAGLGTRLLPLTSVFAKELLPINGKPGLEYIIEECIEAGIKEIIFIISKKKIMIKNYFFNDKFLYEESLKSAYLLFTVMLGLTFYILVAIFIKAFKVSDIYLKY